MRITIEVRAQGDGYRIDRSIAFDGETDKQLSEMYALLDRQDEEQRARIWTKGEHGYFTGSISTGGSGSVGGQKSLDKSAKGGIIGLGSDDSLEQAKTRDRKIGITDIAIEKATAPDIPFFYRRAESKILRT